MRVVKRSRRARPAVSLVLLDWSVRESFQLLHYLEQQTAARETFEVVVVEYYGCESLALAPFRETVDTWALLEMPAACYYHKHLMYNAGIVLARGEVVLFCDSDAMVRETFIESVARAFQEDGRQVLHLDQFRNVRRDLYPFAYPSFEEVLGPGCINNAGGRPRGLAAEADPLHERNYGACMAARRADLIAIGGADEHGDYLGHICGPYEMTFRLGNWGVRERWHPTEFLYHTWHPGQAGEGNYLGPHDGRHMSTTALEALATGRTDPLEANPAIARMRADAGIDAATLASCLIAPDRIARWTASRVSAERRQTDDVPTLLDHYRGYNVVGFRGRVYGVAIAAGTVDLKVDTDRSRAGILRGESLEAVRAGVDTALAGTAGPHPALPAELPVLVVEGYRSFNVVWWSGRFHAIPQGEGAFDPERFGRGGYSRSFEGDSERAVRKLIDRAGRASRWRTVLDLTRRFSGSQP
jgi:hypothetical protein